MTQMAVNRNEQTTVKARNVPFRSIYPFILSPKYPFCTFLAEVKKYQPSMWADRLLSAQVRRLQLGLLLQVLTESFFAWEPQECSVYASGSPTSHQGMDAVETPQGGRGCGCLD